MSEANRNDGRNDKQQSRPARVPLQVRVKTAFTLGGTNGQGIETVDSMKLDAIANKNLKIDIDYDKRIVWVHIDKGNGFVFMGWTPFENVMGVNYGAEVKA